MYASKGTDQLPEILADKISLAGRIHLETSMEEYISKAVREGYEEALIVMHFVNLPLASQTLSRDRLLAETTPTQYLTFYILQQIKLHVDKLDTVLQLDDFNYGLLLHHCNEVEAYRVSLQLQKMLEEDSLLNNLPLPLLVKFGISSYPQLAHNATNLLNQALMVLQNGRKERRLNEPVIKIWKASPRAELSQLTLLNDIEVCRAILQGYSYTPIPRSAYRWLDGDIIPFHFARSNLCLPMKKQRDVLTVALPNPGDQHIVSELARMTGCSIVPVVSTRTEIEKALQYLSRAFV
jgi:GGDEF domain-containing protein